MSKAADIVRRDPVEEDGGSGGCSIGSSKDFLSTVKNPPGEIVRSRLRLEIMFESGARKRSRVTLTQPDKKWIESTKESEAKLGADVVINDASEVMHEFELDNSPAVNVIESGVNKRSRTTATGPDNKWIESSEESDAELGADVVIDDASEVMHEFEFDNSPADNVIESGVSKRSRITSTGPDNKLIETSEESEAELAADVIDDVSERMHGGSRKVNKITWKGSTLYTSMTLKEYEAYVQEMEDFMRHPPGWDDPNSYKEDAAELIHECFPVIQEQWPEMAECELVETMDGAPFLTCSVYAHVNFKAKRKDTENSSITMYFAEFDAVKKEVLCLRKIDADPGTRSDPRCIHCHPEDAHPSAGHVYHPADVDTWLGAC